MFGFHADEGCDHCWHTFVGPVYMEIPQGRYLQECCNCKTKKLTSPVDRCKYANVQVSQS